MPNHDELYTSANKLARRYVSEHPKGGGYLPVLQEVLTRDRSAGEYSLGLVEVPLKKVVGTYLPGRRPAFAGNYMPLLPRGSEFSVKWTAVCQAHLEEGLRDPIRAYEYLGYYYVVEGHKRVSVLKTNDAYSVAAEVTRVLPVWEADNHDVAMLYEYYRLNQRMPVLHMWFSQTGRLTELFNAATRQATDELTPERLLRECFNRFRKSYHDSGFTSLPMTTGDAFYEYVQVFGLNVIDADRDSLGDQIAACQNQWHFSLAGGIHASSPGEERRPRSSLLELLIPKSRPLTIAVAMEGTPENNIVTRLHDIAMRQLAHSNPEVVLRPYYNLPDGEEAWSSFQDMLEGDPGYLLVPSASHTQLAWRASLCSPKTAVLHMSHIHPETRRLSTCWGLRQEPALLCGALAGVLTKTNKIALHAQTWGRDAEEAAAFAFGVGLTNPHARMYSHDRPDAPWTNIRAAFATCKTDVAWLPAGADRRMSGRLFPGVYACLCSISPTDASLQEIWAAAAWHWSAFYRQLADGTLDGLDPERIGDAEQPVVRLRLGLGSGLMDVHFAHILLSSGTLRLMQVLREAILDGNLTEDRDAPSSLPDNVTVLEI